MLPFSSAYQGFGTLLMEEAERIAREEHGSVKLAVISGMSRNRSLFCEPRSHSNLLQVSELETIIGSWDMNLMVHI